MRQQHHCDGSVLPLYDQVGDPPAAEIAEQERLALESQQQVQELAPLRSEFIQVNYAKASELAALISSGETSLLSERGSVTIDARTNTLLVQDTDQSLTDIRRLVRTLDVAVRQVLIEARIVIANNDFSRDLGVRFGVTGVKENGRDGLIGVSGSTAANMQRSERVKKPTEKAGQI